jgi:uncharacterized protein
MSDPYVSAVSGAAGRSTQLDQVLGTLLRQAPDVEAAAVVSFDGLPMASALPAGMDEDRVAAMSAALLSLGERAAQGLGRGDLSQVYVEGDAGTVFLVSADDEAVLVAVARAGAKVGLMLFEVKQAAEAVATALRIEADPLPPLVAAPTPPSAQQQVQEQPAHQPAAQPVQQQPVQQQPVQQQPVQQQPVQQQPVPAAQPANDARSNGHVVTGPQPTPALEPDPLGDPVLESSWDAEQARDRRPATVAPDGSAWS